MADAQGFVKLQEHVEEYLVLLEVQLRIEQNEKAPLLLKFVIHVDLSYQILDSDGLAN